MHLAHAAGWLKAAMYGSLTLQLYAVYWHYIHSTAFCDGIFSLSPFVDDSILPFKKAKTDYNRVQAKSS